MKTTYYPNRVVVAFQVDKSDTNGVHAIIEKHNGQNGLYDNSFGGSLAHDRSHYINKSDTIGGAVTFHSHSCDTREAARELIVFLGQQNEEYKEVTKSHRADGSAYNAPQKFIERI